MFHFVMAEFNQQLLYKYIIVLSKSINIRGFEYESNDTNLAAQELYTNGKIVD